MYINKLIIHNFKGFKHFEMDFSDNVNVIVGNNNEGKTTIFEAIQRTSTMQEIFAPLFLSVAFRIS